MLYSRFYFLAHFIMSDQDEQIVSPEVTEVTPETTNMPTEEITPAAEETPAAE